jgi:hypothetical protein
MTVVNSIADLKALPSATNSFAETLGYYVPGDQGGGSYRLDPTDTTSLSNGGTVIVANDGARWKLMYDSVVSIRPPYKVRLTPVCLTFLSTMASSLSTI